MVLIDIFNIFFFCKICNYVVFSDKHTFPNLCIFLYEDNGKVRKIVPRKITNSLLVIAEWAIEAKKEINKKVCTEYLYKYINHFYIQKKVNGK